MNKKVHTPLAAYLLIFSMAFTVLSFTDLYFDLFRSKLTFGWYPIAGLVVDLILCVVLFLNQKNVVLACAVGLKMVPYLVNVLLNSLRMNYNSILYVASLLLLFVMLLFIGSKKENIMTVICKKLFFLPALVGLVRIVIYIVNIVSVMKIGNTNYSLFPIIFDATFRDFIYVLVMFFVAYWAAYGITMKEKIALFTQATQELDGAFSFWNEELSLKKQDPRFARLIKVDEYIPYVHTSAGTVFRKDLGGHYEIKFWIKEWDSATSADVWRAKPVKKITLSHELKKKARNDESLKDYLDKDGNIVVVKDFNVSYDTKILLNGGDTVHAVNNFNIDKVDSYPMMFECERILDFVYGN